MMTVAKQLSGAYFPISGTMVSNDIYRTIADYSNELGILEHGFTYGGHPVRAAVAFESLNQYEQLETKPSVPALANHLSIKPQEVRDASNHVAHIRQEGLMVDVALAQTEDGRSRAASVVKRREENGVLLRVINDTIAISPRSPRPWTISTKSFRCWPTQLRKNEVCLRRG